MSPLQDAANRIAAEFEITAQDINKAVKVFIERLNDGLQADGTALQQIPSYITAFPTGSEKGTYLAVDLGGTNSRVCSVTLNGDGTYSVIQAKVAIPQHIMLAETARELFQFLGRQIEAFLILHHPERLEQFKQQSNSAERFSLGFTFSYTVAQRNINSGTLIQWDKGFNIADAIGKDVCELLQNELDVLGLPVEVVALVNDTVGTLMTRAYTSRSRRRTMLGAVFGTGTNGAYIEQLDKIKKLNAYENDRKSTDEMILNVEWGGFDDQLDVLPSTSYDNLVDAGSINPRSQLFEKRVGGMYLGEILRVAILKLMKDESLSLFEPKKQLKSSILSRVLSCFGIWFNNTLSFSKSKAAYSSGEEKSEVKSSFLYSQYSMDTQTLSILEGDESPSLEISCQHLQTVLNIPHVGVEDARAVKTIAHAIGKRAARLSGVVVGAVIIHTGILGSFCSDAGSEDENKLKQHIKIEASEIDKAEVDVGVDGSLVELYPGFELMMRGALREICGFGQDGEQRVSIGVAKDGSGVGAALTAHMVEMLKDGRQMV